MNVSFKLEFLCLELGMEVSSVWNLSLNQDQYESMDLAETRPKNILTEIKIQTWLSILLKYQDLKLIPRDSYLDAIYA